MIKHSLLVPPKERAFYRIAVNGAKPIPFQSTGFALQISFEI
ncbi:hypothetical protein PPAR_b0634 [Pseudoalteromonas paragorgicola KMM 3548]|uniref:Uncharacterized protein n=1 Tax=Pseudoalteromonas arctica A 37-1-2 TaxID=1117313 RepID=A0A290SA19_9GAMM|nr:hypothetical protein PARC_b0775 [Pseudoalteromonas arctica A 37-1-2]MBE3675414.1 hypothetical protein [Pseudoalteromonas distincta KMM 3548]GAA67817.1 hypothetical protein P20429_1936 [Pseudoalteromonas sp. BSi20429]GAA78214.1 hypothetical protein P20495_0705 [Pseudoalteromonas sp. BSi20495]